MVLTQVTDENEVFSTRIRRAQLTQYEQKQWNVSLPIRLKLNVL